MTFNQIYESLMTRILLEARPDRRIEFLINKFPKLEAKLIDDIVRQVDPTHGEYSEWIVRGYQKLTPSQQSRFYEDAYKITEALTSYHKHKNKLKSADADDVLVDDAGKRYKINQLNDINKIPDYSILYTVYEEVLRSYEEEDQSAQLDLAEASKVDKIFSNNNWLIVVPLTYEASCKYGAGTRWCTASRNHDTYYHQYTRKGPLYIIIHKESQEKWQFHFQSDAYMNAEDDSINLRKWVEENVELRPILSELAKKNGVKWALKQIDPDGYVEMIVASPPSDDPNIFRNESVYIVLKLAEKIPDRVNKGQDVFKCSEHGVRMMANDFEALVDFVGESRHGNERKTALELIEGSYESNNDTWIKYDEDYWDWVDQSNLTQISEYLQAHKDDYESEEEYDLEKESGMRNFVEEHDIDDIKDALTRAFSDVYDRSGQDVMYKAALNPILSHFGENYEWIEHNGKIKLTFPLTRYQDMFSLVNNIEKTIDSDNPDITLGSFYDDWATHLVEENELEVPAYDQACMTAYPSRKDYENDFNERLGEILHDLR